MKKQPEEEVFSDVLTFLMLPRFFFAFRIKGVTHGFFYLMQRIEDV
jgi:hypothetical protein